LHIRQLICDKSHLTPRFYRRLCPSGAPQEKLFLFFIHQGNKTFHEEKLRDVKKAIVTAIYSGFNGAALEEQQ